MAMNLAESVARLQAVEEENDLYRLLALRVRAIDRDPTKAADMEPAVDEDEVGIALIDLVEFGKRTFGRLALAGHGLVCGADAQGTGRLEGLLATMGKDSSTVVIAIAGLLTAQLAVPGAIAGVVATIIVGKVAPSSLDALCTKWASKLPPPAPLDPTATVPVPPIVPTPPAPPDPTSTEPGPPITGNPPPPSDVS